MADRAGTFRFPPSAKPETWRASIDRPRRPGSTELVWRCIHLHVNEASALACAEAELQLRDSEADYAAGRIDLHALLDAEKAHLAAQPPIDASTPLVQGMKAIDRDRDVWRWGRTRWSCMTGPGRVRDLAEAYGPARIIGDRSGWRYSMLRGHHHG